MGDVGYNGRRSGNRDALHDRPARLEDRDCGSGAAEVKPIGQRTKVALKELMRSWDDALSEPVPKDMKELLARLK
jgi:hypothetical protein